jgi:1-aminocyclopropane-1-carboxylate deaminase/D-cysteine desulfhydrase-like pyridoxal-dependent ACC family enzyme
MTELQDKKVFIQHLINKCLTEKRLCRSALRLDELHPIISGNKWFKLKYFLEEAVKNGSRGLLTFGGAYSNHILATAFAARSCGLISTGIIRGERPLILSPTLLSAESYGMNLIFSSRADYRQRWEADYLHELALRYPDYLIIPEGGASPTGIKGAADILSLCDTDKYSHIICAIGTGTMFCGIASAVPLHQELIGISVLKGIPESIKNEFARQINRKEVPHNWKIITDFHFGGYAKKNDLLLQFMNDLYKISGIPTDFVYTGKLFYAVDALCRKSYFPAGSKLLIIHCGGLQGNDSLEKGVLLF